MAGAGTGGGRLPGRTRDPLHRAPTVPTLGGAEPRRALMTYWALGSRGLVGVESLTGLGEVPQRAYFIFAPIKIRDSHGGPGRALALY